MTEKLNSLLKKRGFFLLILCSFFFIPLFLFLFNLSFTNPVSASELKKCSEIAQGYNSYLCSNMTTTGYGCGPASDPQRANICYYNINVTQSSDCYGETPYCRYYNRTTCGNTNSECQSRCSANGCKVATTPTYTPTPTPTSRPTPTPISCPPAPSNLSFTDFSSHQNKTWELNWTGFFPSIDGWEIKGSADGQGYCSYNKYITSIFDLDKIERNQDYYCDSVNFTVCSKKSGCPDNCTSKSFVADKIPCKLADFNSNNFVDDNDYNFLLSCKSCNAWSACWSNCWKADLNKDLKVDVSDEAFFGWCDNHSFCLCKPYPTPPKTVITIPVAGYSRDEVSFGKGLSGARVTVKKYATNNCTGVQYDCGESITNSSGYFEVFCKDVPLKSILIQEQINPSGYTDSTKSTSVPAGCSVLNKNTVCCKTEGKTSLGGQITFFNTLKEKINPFSFSASYLKSFLPFDLKSIF